MNLQCTCTRISYSLFVDIGESKWLYFAMKVLLACVSGPLPVKVLRIFNFFWLLGHGSPKISYVFCLHLGGGKYCDSFYAFFFLSMFDVGGQRDERRKWIQCFNGMIRICFL